MNPFEGSSSPQQARRASLDDVAQAAGVGKSTAARALKGDKHVARKTQRVVMEAAQKLGYQPDPILSTLARERWRGREGYSGVSIALVYYPPARGEADLNTHLEGIMEVAGPRGYKVDVIDASQLPHAARLEEILITRNYRGLILGPMHCPEGWLRLDWSPFCVVAFGTGPGHPPIDAVGLDHLHCTQIAFRQAVELGYQRPGLALLHTPGGRDYDDILSASHLAAMHHGLEALPVYDGNEEDAAPFLRWVAECRPDCLLADSSTAHAWLTEAGLTGPGGIGFAGIGLTKADRDLAGVRPEAEQVGRRAMELLDHHVCTNTRGVPSSPARLVVTPTWMDGPSLPPRAPQ